MNRTARLTIATVVLALVLTLLITELLLQHVVPGLSSRQAFAFGALWIVFLNLLGSGIKRLLPSESR